MLERERVRDFLIEQQFKVPMTRNFSLSYSKELSK